MNAIELSTSMMDAGDMLARLDAMSPEEAGEFYSRVAALKAEFREWCQALDESMVEYVQSNGDVPIQTADGTKRLYVGVEKRTKCPDPKATLQAMFEASGGDFDAVARCLASGAWKHGACRPVLGERWGECFTVEEVVDLKTGAPKRALKQTQEVDGE